MSIVSFKIKTQNLKTESSQMVKGLQYDLSKTD